MLADAIGYTGQVFGHPLEARWVGFHWERSGDEVVYDDGRASSTGEYTGYLAFVDHPMVAVHLRHFDFGSSEAPPRYYLVLDRVNHHLYALPMQLAQHYLHSQWQEQGPASETGAVRQVGSVNELVEALSIDTWQEVTLPGAINAEIKASMERQYQLLSDLVKWLDVQRKAVMEERIAEYESHAPAMLLRHVVDNDAFAQAGEFVHIQEVHESSDQIIVTFFRDNSIDGPDESDLFSVSGSWKTIMETIETLLELGPLDDLLESEAPLEPLFGHYAAWNGLAFPIVPMLETLAIRVSLPCARCGKNPTVAYARAGCHRGAFCYVYDAEANFLADLRNQEYVCSRCGEKGSE